MLLRGIRKRYVSSGIIKKFACLSFLLLFGNIVWMVFHKNIRNDFTVSFSNLNINSETENNRTTNIYDNILQNKKIDDMKKVLNNSVLNNDSKFPANMFGRYLMFNPSICKNVDHINIIIVVHTALPNFEQRQRIRDSFGNPHLFQPFGIRVVFLLGNTYNKTLERILWLEHVRYNDTVMGDFIDHYHNLSVKGVMGYHWVSEYCSDSDLVLKIDDDVLVNMFQLLYTYFPHMLSKKRSIFCNVWDKGRMQILREGKWKVDSHIFSSLDTFPYHYCSGFLVIITSDLIRPMYEAVKITPFFWIDDVYLFGMLPSIVGRVTYYNYALEKSLTLNEKTAVNCTLSQGPKCSIFATIISDQSYWMHWNKIKEIYTLTNWTVNKVFVEK